MEAGVGPPGLPRSQGVSHAMVKDPGEAGASRPVALAAVLASGSVTPSSFPMELSRLDPFSRLAYGLTACGPTLKVGDCSPSSKDSLPGGWPTLPGRDSHPLDIATLPGRTSSRRVSSGVAGEGLFSLFAAWFPGGATIFPPCHGWPPPLSEPCWRNSRTRLLSGLAPTIRPD